MEELINKDRPAFYEHAKALYNAAMLAAEAADKKDADKVFEVGETIEQPARMPPELLVSEREDSGIAGREMIARRSARPLPALAAGVLVLAQLSATHAVLLTTCASLLVEHDTRST